MEVNIAHVDATIQLLKCHKLFLAIFRICSLLADVLQNEMVGPIERMAVDKAM